MYFVFKILKILCLFENEFRLIEKWKRKLKEIAMDYELFEKSVKFNFFHNLVNWTKQHYKLTWDKLVKCKVILFKIINVCNNFKFTCTFNWHDKRWFVFHPKRDTLIPISDFQDKIKPKNCDHPLFKHCWTVFHS